MIRKSLFITMLTIIISSSQVSARNLSGLNKFSTLNVFSNNTELKVDIELSGNINNVNKPKLFKKSFELMLDKSFISPPKRMFAVGDSLIDSVYAVQFSKDKVKLRFNFAESAVTDLKDIRVESDSNRVTIYIKKPVTGNNNLQATKVNQAVKVNTEIKSEGKITSNRFIEKSADLSVLPEKVGDSDKKESSKTNKKDVKDFKKIGSLSEAVLSEKENDILKSLTKEESSKKDKENLEFLKGLSKGSTKNKFNKKITSASSKKNDESNLYYASLKMIVALLLTLAVMFLIVYLFKKYSKSSVFGLDKPIKVISSCYIGSKSSIAIVDVLGEILVVGITGSNISILSKIEDEEKLSKLKKTDMSTGKKVGSLDSLLANLIKSKRLKNKGLKEFKGKKVKEVKEVKGPKDADNGFGEFLDGVMKDDIVKTKSKDESIEKVANMIQKKLTNIRGT